MTAINTDFGKDLSKYGAFDFNACYNCGTCTAVCTLSTDEDSFPREMQRFSVLGLEDDLKGSLKPWLCYYCGQCTTYCPQNANPGELMMSLRRWLFLYMTGPGCPDCCTNRFLPQQQDDPHCCSSIILFIFS
jgi:heterodisulfide reductase subunit C